MAWLLAQKSWFVPIPGTTKLHRLEENLGDASVVLAADDLKSIHDAISSIDVLAVNGPLIVDDLELMIHGALERVGLAFISEQKSPQSYLRAD